MEIKHLEKNNQGAFIIKKDGKHIAELTYSKVNENLFVIDHTEVSEELRGTGTGEALVMEAVKYARENNQKIIPECSYARSVFKRRTDIKDVLFSV